MRTPLSPILALGFLAALLPFSLACDNADPFGPPPAFDSDPDDDGAAVEVDAEALAAVFGCEVDVVALGEQAEGMFEDAPCRLEDDRSVAYYAFGVDEEATVSVAAGSAWFDTVLHLYDAEGNLLGENDDVDPFDTNSRLEADLARGVYVAGLTSFETGQEGFYRFIATR